jgi:anaerobic selenocysteine-containing dehydrogenase
MAYQLRVQGEQTAVLHADDAEARGIEEGMPVRLFNERGEIKAVARIGAGEVAQAQPRDGNGEQHHPHGLR